MAKYLLQFVMLFASTFALGQDIEAYVNEINQQVKSEEGYQLVSRKNSWESAPNYHNYNYGSNYLFLIISVKGSKCYSVDDNVYLYPKKSRDWQTVKTVYSTHYSNDDFTCRYTQAETVDSGKHRTSLQATDACRDGKWVVLVYKKK